MFQIHLNVCHLGYIILTLLLAKQLMLFNLAHFVRSIVCSIMWCLGLESDVLQTLALNFTLTGNGVRFTTLLT